MFGYNPYQFGIDANTLPVLENLVVWLDAADANTLSFSSGILVSDWVDKSGNNHDAVQATAGDQPDLIADAINGLPVLRFDGATEFMELDTVVVTGTSGRSLFCVASARALNAAADSIVSLNQANGTAIIYLWTPETAVRIQGVFVVWADSIIDPGTAPFEYWVYNVANATGADGNTIQGWRNGTEMTPTPTNSGTINTSTTGVTQISRSQNGNFFYEGDIGEIIIYDRDLSVSERQSVVNYLGAKWGIAVTHT